MAWSVRTSVERSWTTWMVMVWPWREWIDSVRIRTGTAFVPPTVVVRRSWPVARAAAIASSSGRPGGIRKSRGPAITRSLESRANAKVGEPSWNSYGEASPGSVRWPVSTARGPAIASSSCSVPLFAREPATAR